jgi:hypothetical protein
MIAVSDQGTSHSSPMISQAGEMLCELALSNLSILKHVALTSAGSKTKHCQASCVVVTSSGKVAISTTRPPRIETCCYSTE